MRPTFLRNVTRLFHSVRQVFRNHDQRPTLKKRHSRWTRFRPTLEVLETREMPAGITITPSSGLVTTGTGGTTTFSVVLDTLPLGTVTLDLSSSNTNEGTVAPTTLLFTLLDWNQPQTVTLTGQNDGVVQGNQAYTITVSVDLILTTDPTYLLLPSETVSATNLNPNVNVDVTSSAPSGSTYGSNVTFTADVAPFTGLPTPTGTVQFVVDGSDYGSPVGLDGSGDATLNTNTLSAGTHSVVADYIPAGGSQYLGNSGSLAGGQLVNKADATIVVDPYSVTYDGLAQTDTGNATGALGEDLSSLLNLSGTSHTNAGTYSDTWTFAGNANYNASTGSVTDTIAKADATIDVNPYSVTYDGNAHTASGTATGVVGEDLSSELDLSGTTHTDAGSYSDTWTFTDTTGNYNDASGTIDDSISQAGSTVTVTWTDGTGVTYDGSAHGATASWASTGTDGEGGPLAVAYVGIAGTVYDSSIAPTNAGQYEATATFAGDADHTGSTNSADFTIAKADATIDVSGYSVTYNGNAQTASGTATGVQGEDLSSELDLSGTTHTNAGTYSDTWTFTDTTGNYNDTSSIVSDTINKANATITVNGYSVTYDGDSHTATGTASGVQGEDLSGELDLSGTTHTAAGTYSDTWTFSGDANYNSTSSTVTDIITQAGSTVTVTWTDGTGVTYDGSAHGATASWASTGTDGEGGPLAVAYVGIAGTVYDSSIAPTNAGQYEATATFAGDADHTGSTNSADFTIARADATIDVSGYSVTYDGNAQTASGTATGVVGEDLSSELDLSGTTHTNAGTYSDTWTFSGDSNYNSASGTVSDSIAKADATISVSGYTGIYDGYAHGATGTAIGVLGDDLSSELNLGAQFSNVPGGTAFWTFTDTTGNYNDASGSVDIVISKANASITVTPYSVTYDGSPQTASDTAMGVLGEDLSGELDLSGTTHTNAGTYSDSWSFTDTTGNYNDTSGTVTDTIGKADATITVNGYNVTYDGNAQTAAGTATGVLGEDLSALLDLLATSHTNAGTFTDGWSFAGNSNYNSASGSVTDSIAKANATISVSGYSVTYDGNSHTATASATGVLGEDLSGLFDLTATTHSNAGNYSDTWTFTGNGNYNSDSGSLTDVIAQRDATWITNDAGKTYGEADPGTLTTGSGSGFVASDGVTATYSRAAGETVGSYVITATLTATGDLANYNITNAGAVFTISPATLTVTADNQTRVSGDTNPTLTYGISGFQNGETLATSGVTGTPIVSTSATQASAPGVYTISVGVGTLQASNYTFKLVSSTLTVTPVSTSTGGNSGTGGTDTPGSGSGTIITILNPPGSSGGSTNGGSQGGGQATEPSSPPNNAGPAAGTGQGVVLAEAGGKVVSGDEQPAQPPAVPLHVVAAPPRDQPRPVVAAADPPRPGAPAPAPPAAAPELLPAPASSILENQLLWKALDELNHQVDAKPDLQVQLAGTVTIGIAVTVGYVLLASRAALWLLMALTARPMWRQFDPLDVIYAWEQEKDTRRAEAEEKEESLQSIVDNH